MNDGEQVRRRYPAKIKKMDQGILYFTSTRMCFESERYGLCLDLPYHNMYNWGRDEKNLYVTWYEPLQGRKWKFSDHKFEAKIELGNKKLNGEDLSTFEVAWSLYYSYVFSYDVYDEKCKGYYQDRFGTIYDHMDDSIWLSWKDVRKKKRHYMKYTANQEPLWDILEMIKGGTQEAYLKFCGVSLPEYTCETNEDEWESEFFYDDPVSNTNFKCKPGDLLLQDMYKNVLTERYWSQLSSNDISRYSIYEPVESHHLMPLVDEMKKTLEHRKLSLIFEKALLLKENGDVLAGEEIMEKLCREGYNVARNWKMRGWKTIKDACPDMILHARKQMILGIDLPILATPAMSLAEFAAAHALEMTYHDRAIKILTEMIQSGKINIKHDFDNYKRQMYELLQEKFDKSEDVSLWYPEMDVIQEFPTPIEAIEQFKKFQTETA
ncbi:MAG: hypothetical protein OXC46_02870 [Thaumarchaeota archaeon]|nr:hypothetical protein [Nitrososphaerota archaeon]